MYIVSICVHYVCALYEQAFVITNCVH